jgi:hypothetical protein
MQAHAGDQIRVRAHHTGDPERRGQILETRGADGSPPFVVRWDDNDHDVLFFPGNDAIIDQLAANGGPGS